LIKRFAIFVCELDRKSAHMTEHGAKAAQAGAGVAAELAEAHADLARVRDELAEARRFEQLYTDLKGRHAQLGEHVRDIEAELKLHNAEASRRRELAEGFLEYRCEHPAEAGRGLRGLQ